jgi:hypothetical protein
VTGVLPVANGGTGGSAVGAAGSSAFSNGSVLSYTAVGAAGQVLTSAGAGTPTWTTPAGGTITGGASDGTQAIFNGTVGTTLHFKGVDAGSARITATPNATQVLLDVSEPNVNINALGGGPLSLVNGGTNNSLVADNGSVAYSNATQLALTGAGSQDQVLTSNGVAAPTWTTINSSANPGVWAPDFDNGGANIIEASNDPAGSGWTNVSANVNIVGTVRSQFDNIRNHYVCRISLVLEFPVGSPIAPGYSYLRLGFTLPPGGTVPLSIANAIVGNTMIHSSDISISTSGGVLAPGYGVSGGFVVMGLQGGTQAFVLFEADNQFTDSATIGITVNSNFMFHY